MKRGSKYFDPLFVLLLNFCDFYLTLPNLCLFYHQLFKLWYESNLGWNVEMLKILW